MISMASLSRPFPARPFAGRDQLAWTFVRGLASSQRRCRQISPKHLAKVEHDQNIWKQRAEEIEQGKRKNLFDEFEDRGLIKDIVG